MDAAGVKWRGPKIAWLLLGVNALIFVLPVAGLMLWRIYDQYLLRQTERQLIAQSVVVAEAYRGALWREMGVSGGEPRPPGRVGERYVALEPLIDLGTDIGPHEELVRLPEASGGDSPAKRAGASIEGLLERMQIFNLSGVRVLDAEGCVVATTGGQRGRCMGTLAEVAQALSGQYASKARYRMPANPLPPLGDIRRRGQVRVFTALPIFSDGDVVGVVAASRTGLDALSSLWQIRRRLLSSAAIVVAVMVLISLIFARAITRPLRALTLEAQAIARGDAAGEFVPKGFTPAELRALGHALDVMTRRLRDQAKYVSDFATTVSHELKTPIAAIRGAVELLHDWESMEPAQRQRFLGNVDQDAKRMQRLVTRLLSLARIESASELPASRVEVAPFVEGLLTRYGQQVSLELVGAPDTVQVAEEHLAAVVDNLVDNALRHARNQEGDVTPKVVVTLSSEEGRLSVAVSDNGPGISAANQRKIGTRFFTTERDRGGTGLGLSIVQAIARSRGGDLSFDSSSAGTTFRVSL